MLQGLLWLFDDPLAPLLLAGIFVLAALHHRQMRLMQQRTNQLAFQVSELKMLMINHVQWLCPRWTLSNAARAIHAF